MNEPRTLFTVVGPRTIPTHRGRASRTITDDNVRAFWRDNGDIAQMRGCYIFAVRVGPTLKPAYVGKATRSFRQEAFQYHKRVRYQEMLADCLVGVPLMFFVALPRRRGAPPTTHVTELERFLIATAREVNPRLLNARCTGVVSWAITGVSYRQRGKPSSSTRLFRALMQLRR
jgi:hypothetical protein